MNVNSPTTVSRDAFEVGTVTTSVGATPDLTNTYQQYMDDLSAVMGRLYSDPSSITAGDFMSVVSILASLKTVVLNGDGNGHYLTETQVMSINDIILSFEKFNIYPDPNRYVSLTDEEKVNLLMSTKTSSTSDPKNDPLQVQIQLAGSLKYQTESVATAIYDLMFNDIIPYTQSQLEDLNDYLKLTQETTAVLNQIMDIGNGVEVKQTVLFGTDEINNLFNSDIKKACTGSIPPSAVPALKDYLNSIKPGQGDKFEEAFNKEYNAAVKAAKPPATVKDEMMRVDQNGNAVYNEAAKILRDTVGDKNEYRTGVINICQQSMTVTTTSSASIETGEALYQAMLALGAYSDNQPHTPDGYGGLIYQLYEAGADDSKLKPLKKVYDDMVNLMMDILRKNPTGGPEIFTEFANQWAVLYSTDNNVNGDVQKALGSLSNMSTELQSSIKSLITQLQAMAKIYSDMIRSLDSTTQGTLSKISR